ncbi:TRAP transporter small permease [Ureibacillus sp. NPDC094379]
MNTILKSIDGINKLVKILLTFSLIVMTIIMILQVFSRFILNIPLPWSEEATRYLGIYSVFFGAALAIRHNELISVEAIPDLLPKTVQRVLKMIVLVICIVFFAILLKYGIDLVSKVSIQKSPALQISMSIPYFSIPLGAFLLILNGIAALIVVIKGGDEE